MPETEAISLEFECAFAVCTYDGVSMITPTTALVIGGIALIVLGPKKLPELARGVGKAMGIFRKELHEAEDALASDAPAKPSSGADTGRGAEE